ncbi:MAG: hypothetical protein K5928_02920 [Prevotella sp.]|nr:hypothetical protein [Prevotella sp.]
MKRFLLFVLAAIACMGAKAQGVNFMVQSDGSFLTADGKKYVELDYPQYTQAELYYAFLVTIEHKCVTSGVQFSTVGNKCINVYSYEKYFSSWGVWSGGFEGYLYYKFMFQFKDGKVRVDDPIVDHLGNGAKNTLYMKFAEMLHQRTRPLFNADGSVVEKRADDVASLNRELNMALDDIIQTANSILEWQH